MIIESAYVLKEWIFSVFPLRVITVTSTGKVIFSLVLNNIRYVILLTVILGDCEGSKITLDLMGGYEVSGGYITKFHNLEMKFNNGISKY